MKFILAKVVALGLAVFSVFAQSAGPMVNTPSAPVVCEVSLFTWTSNGKPPYTLSILPAAELTGAPLFIFPDTNATQVSWLVDMIAGTSIVLKIADNLGESNESGPITIQANTASSNATCIGSTSFTFDGTAAAGATTAQSPSSATTTSPSTGNTVTSNSGSAATPGSSARTSSTSSSSTAQQSGSGASRVTGQIAAAGIIGAAMVALLG